MYVLPLSVHSFVHPAIIEHPAGSPETMKIHLEEVDKRKQLR